MKLLEICNKTLLYLLAVLQNTRVSSGTLLCKSCTQNAFQDGGRCIAAADDDSIVDVGERYCSVDEVCLTEVSFVTSTYEVVRVSRKCAMKEFDDNCHAANAQGTIIRCNYTCSTDECNKQHAKMLILNDEAGQVSNYLDNLPKHTLLKDLLHEVEEIKAFLHSVHWVFEDFNQKLQENVHCLAIFASGVVMVLVVMPKLFASLVVSRAP